MLSAAPVERSGSLIVRRPRRPSMPASTPLTRVSFGERITVVLNLPLIAHPILSALVDQLPDEPEELSLDYVNQLGRELMSLTCLAPYRICLTHPNGEELYEAHHLVADLKDCAFTEDDLRTVTRDSLAHLAHPPEDAIAISLAGQAMRVWLAPEDAVQLHTGVAGKPAELKNIFVTKTEWLSNCLDKPHPLEDIEITAIDLVALKGNLGTWHQRLSHLDLPVKTMFEAPPCIKVFQSLAEQTLTDMATLQRALIDKHPIHHLSSHVGTCLLQLYDRKALLDPKVPFVPHRIPLNTLIPFSLLDLTLLSENMLEAKLAPFAKEAIPIRTPQGLSYLPPAAAMAYLRSTDPGFALTIETENPTSLLVDRSSKKKKKIPLTNRRGK